MTHDQVLRVVVDRFGSTSSYAKHLGVSHSFVYQVFRGGGSRKARIEIAQLLHLKPSEIWPDNSVVVKIRDDIDYCGVYCP